MGLRFRSEEHTSELQSHSDLVCPQSALFPYTTLFRSYASRLMKDDRGISPGSQWPHPRPLKSREMVGQIENETAHDGDRNDRLSSGLPEIAAAKVWHHGIALQIGRAHV